MFRMNPVRTAPQTHRVPLCPDGSPGDVVVVDHHDSYTWNLVHLIAGVTGVLPRVVQHDAVSPSEVLEHDYVVLSPGPGRPDRETDFAVGTEVLRAGTTAVLGVCLGMQGLVTTYGGRVEQVTPGHGVLGSIVHDSTGLFAGLPAAFEAVRYHSLAAVTLPDCLERTAVDTRSGLTMAVRHRDLPLVGVQFHPESILSEYGAAIVANFLAGPRGRDE